MKFIKTNLVYILIFTNCVLVVLLSLTQREQFSLQQKVRDFSVQSKEERFTQRDFEDVALAMELLTSWQYMEVTNLTTKDYYTYLKPAMNSKSSFVRVKAAGLISRQKGEYMSDALATIIKMLSQKEEYDGMIILSLAVLRIDETKRREVLDILQAKREEGVITSSQYSKIESEVEDFLKRKNQRKSKSPK